MSTGNPAKLNREDGAPSAPVECGNSRLVGAWPETIMVSVLITSALAAILALPILASYDTLALSSSVASAVPVLAGLVLARWSLSETAMPADGRLTVASTGTIFAIASATVIIVLAGEAATGRSIQLWSGIATWVLATSAILFAAWTRDAEIRTRLRSRRLFLVATRAQRDDLSAEVANNRQSQIVGFHEVDDLTPHAVATDAMSVEFAAAAPTMIILNSTAWQERSICEAAARFNVSGGRVRRLDSFFESQFGKVTLSDLTPAWFLFDIAEIHHRRAYGVFKRLVECGIAIVGLIVAAPMLAIAAICIVTESRGGIFYRQERIGRGDVPFSVVKLRTMTVAEDSSPGWASADRARVTRTGRLLRRFRFDEVPQLWNVLRAQMSLVGPRPEQVPLVELLEHAIPYYRARHAVRPGITGWAQVHAGYAGSVDGAAEKLQYDLFYVRNQSLRLDALILLRTIRTVLRGEG